MTTLRCGAWNLRVGRPRGVVAREVRLLLLDHDLDVLTVCEAYQYVDHLADHLPPGYRLVRSRQRDDSARNSAIIVRRGLRVRGKRLHRLERGGWERGEGRPGLHHPRSAVSVKVEGVRFVAVHLPPGPHNAAWPLRTRAWTASLATLVRIARRVKAPLVLAGDWNRPPGDIAMTRFVATVADVRVGTGIDYVVARGVAVMEYHRLHYGTSDHEPVLYRVRKGVNP